MSYIYKFLNWIDRISLKKKLVISFAGLIIVPLFVLSVFSLNLYSEEIQKTVIKSSIQSNEQINKNLDTFLGMLSKLSEYPMKDGKMRNILTKDYSSEEHPEYEEGKDRDTVKELLYNNIKSYSDIIDSVILYKSGTYEIMGRTPRDSLNTSYSPSNEDWFKKILSYEGGCAIIGIHTDYQQTPRGSYVISVGRSIVDPDFRKSIGAVVVNIRINDLEKLWMDAKLTSNSSFYLVDENNKVVFSRDKLHINKGIDSVLGEKLYFNDSSYMVKKLAGIDHYIISSKSDISGWTVLSVIPKKELFSYINTMFYITILIGVSITVLSVIIAVFIATGVTRPLYKLNHKMKLIGKGNFDVEIDETSGEVGEISKTVKKMIVEIKRLISEIYREEEEKRNAEMNALQAQINPHFLYNTLNTIKWMASMQGAKGIESALSSLSALFSAIAGSVGDFIPIREEIKFIQDYIAILNLRYYNRFTVEYEIEEQVYGYKTLKFLLQPVVENAIFHGIEGVDRKGMLRICSCCREGKILFSIEDNGKGISKSVMGSIFDESKEISHKKLNSIGIPNIQKRIKLFFGDEYGITIESIDELGTKVNISIPAVPLEESNSMDRGML